jgi:hypothetical protein
MSPRSSKPQPAGPVAPGIYDGLMLVAVTAMIAGIVFLVLELGKYGWQINPS